MGVPVKLSVPAALMSGPFTSAEASAVGVTCGKLRGSIYRPLGSGLYRWIGLKESPHPLPIIREPPASLGFGALLIRQSLRLSLRWKPGFECSSCLRDSPGQRLKFPSATIKAVS